MKIDGTLKKRFKELRNLPNVLNVAPGTKIVNKLDTGKPCITVYVIRKLEPKILSSEETVPPTVNGIATDVIELKADYTLGDTGVSRKLPEIQRRIAGGVKR